jgi:nicotinate phosphoribosyltransferase
MDGGRRLGPPEPLDTIRDRCVATLAALPLHLRALEPASGPQWPVDVSDGLQALADKVRDQLGDHR